jgi:hypothetical protein
LVRQHAGGGGAGHAEGGGGRAETELGGEAKAGDSAGGGHGLVCEHAVPSDCTASLSAS